MIVWLLRIEQLPELAGPPLSPHLLSKKTLFATVFWRAAWGLDRAAPRAGGFTAVASPPEQKNTFCNRVLAGRVGGWIEQLPELAGSPLSPHLLSKKTLFATVFWRAAWEAG
jgi:hypothetical protein